MFIGSVNDSGFIKLVKQVLQYLIPSLECNFCHIEFGKSMKVLIEIDVPNSNIQNTWTNNRVVLANPFYQQLSSVNFLSKKFNIVFFDSDRNEVKREQYFEGKITKGTASFSVECSFVEVDFQLDDKIWAGKLKWNSRFYADQINDLAYLISKTKFKIVYLNADEKNVQYFQYKNGLKDKLDFELVKDRFESSFTISQTNQFLGFHLEIAIGFRKYSAKQSFIISYSNYYNTIRHGSHVEGILKGLKEGAEKFSKNRNISYNFDDGILKRLVGFIHIQKPIAVYHGAQKETLVHPEIVEPIQNYICDLFFNELLNDNELVYYLFDQTYK